jgi:transcriptional regulator with XRE-family HTH domain
MAAEDFGAKLKELRERAGLSQRALADKAGVGQESISSWEQNRRTATWPNVVALCQALAVSCEEFLEEPARPQKAKRGRPPNATLAEEPARETRGKRAKK